MTTKVEQPTDAALDAHAPQRDDVVKATPSDVTHDVSAGSETDDAPELIADSLSRDHDATNQHHDHQHPPVGQLLFRRRQ